MDLTRDMLGSLKDQLYQTSRQFKTKLDSSVSEVVGSVAKRPQFSKDPLPTTTMKDASTENSMDQIKLLYHSSNSISCPDLNSVGQSYQQRQQERYQQLLQQNDCLIQSGENLWELFAEARKHITEKLKNEEQIKSTNRVLGALKNDVQNIRILVEDISIDIEKIEAKMISRIEQKLAVEMASYAEEKQRQLEKYEEDRLRAKEARKLEIADERRKALEEALQSDLEAYRLALEKQEIDTKSHNSTKEDLGELDLNVEDLSATTLDGFYSEDENEEAEKGKEDEGKE